jgi:hypothetical protein
VGKAGVGVLEESDGNYICQVSKTCSMLRQVGERILPSQWFTQR